LFQRLDANGDGQLSKDEFKKLATLGQGKFKDQPAVFDRIFEQLDADRSGALSQVEFKTLPKLRGGAQPATPAPSASPASGESDSLWRDAIDPEIHQNESLMTYQDSRGAIILEHLDPKTGRADANKARIQLDTGAANLRQTFNGPEFGTDANGWAVFYTKASGDDFQLWRARLVDGNAHAAPVFRDGQHRQSVLASKSTDAKSTRLIYVKGGVKDGAFHWADVSVPERETRIIRTMGVDSPRWIDDTLSYVFAEAEGPDKGQIKMRDTVTGKTTVISGDVGEKSFAYGWKSPEFGGEILVLSLINRSAIGIWRRTSADKWERIQTITPPAESRYRVFGSPEPLACEGRSYISAVIKSEGGTMRFRDSEVWLFGVDSAKTKHYAARVDAGGIERTRSDAETLTIGGTVHVYYNIFQADKGYRIGHAALKPATPKAHTETAGRTPDKVARSEATPKAGLAKLYKPADDPRQVVSVPDMVLRDDKRGKDLQLRVGFPKDGGSFPVIVFAHGATGTKDDYQPLVKHWVGHGYVCVQANHSDSRALAGMAETGKVANKFGDWVNRPKDIVFILDSLDAIEAKVEGLKGKMDKKTIGVGGHSFGAHTAQLVAGTTTVDFGGARTSHSDARPKAFVLISPQGKGPQLDDQSWNTLTRPFLSITGSNDWGREGDPVDWRLDPFRLASSKTKHLLYIEGAYHDFGGMGGGVQYRNAGPANPNHLAYVKSTTIAFWDAYLKDDRTARSYLHSHQVQALSEGEAKLTFRGAE
jgi:dienelactone hydrolase